MNITRGDIVKVDLSGTEGSEIKKTRPAIVVQNDVGNEFSPCTIIAPCSTSSDGSYPVEVPISADEEPVDKDTVVKLDQIRTVDIEERVMEKYGTLSPSSMRKIDKAIRISLGI